MAKYVKRPRRFSRKSRRSTRPSVRAARLPLRRSLGMRAPQYFQHRRIIESVINLNEVMTNTGFFALNQSFRLQDYPEYQSAADLFRSFRMNAVAMDITFQNSQASTSDAQLPANDPNVQIEWATLPRSAGQTAQLSFIQVLNNRAAQKGLCYTDRGKALKIYNKTRIERDSEGGLVEWIRPPNLSTLTQSGIHHFTNITYFQTTNNLKPPTSVFMKVRYTMYITFRGVSS